MQLTALESPLHEFFIDFITELLTAAKYIY